jgi:hypothetical protein
MGSPRNRNHATSACCMHKEGPAKIKRDKTPGFEDMVALEYLTHSCINSTASSRITTHLSLQLSQNLPSANASGNAALSLATASASVRPVANLKEVLAPGRGGGGGGGGVGGGGGAAAVGGGRE